LPRQSYEILEDEPDWKDVLRVVPIELDVGPCRRIKKAARAFSCCVRRPLFCLYFGQQFVDHLRRVDAHEPAKEAAPLPPNSTLCRIPEPLCTVRADPHVPVGFRTPDSIDIAPDVRAG
jgi:hypothetical protein